MASATSKITACGCAYCAAEMDGELFRNLSEKLPVEGACPRLWCRAPLKGLAPVFGVEPKKSAWLLALRTFLNFFGKGETRDYSITNGYCCIIFYKFFCVPPNIPPFFSGVRLAGVSPFEERAAPDRREEPRHSGPTGSAASPSSYHCLHIVARQGCR